ncbi:hypothetical protein QTH87_20235 [Variovorax sp. J22P168]|uniref:hypothetical protein n=1 Tax=Variovorax jilinensis TaxID=3053513 RepID=UPI002574D213|nr:hypothetical protein [Variovorax sp. J22P168]MDM0014784.1 hypothetical protein [Variovorax sp. J22P168]
MAGATAWRWPSAVVLAASAATLSMTARAEGGLPGGLVAARPEVRPLAGVVHADEAESDRAPDTTAGGAAYSPFVNLSAPAASAVPAVAADAKDAHPSGGALTTIAVLLAGAAATGWLIRRAS